MRGTGRERLRLLGTGLLVTSAAFEAYWIATVDIQVPRDGLGVVMVSRFGLVWFGLVSVGRLIRFVQWHDRLYIARQVIFLIVPTIAHNLAASPTKPISPLFLLSRTVSELGVTESKAQTLDLTHSAVMRNPALRGNADLWWDWQRREAEWAKSDAELAEEAERIDLGFTPGNPETGEEEGRLFGKVRNAVRELGKMAWGWEDRGRSQSNGPNLPPQMSGSSPQPT